MPASGRLAGAARSGSTIGRCWWWASMHGPSPRVYCSSSISALTSSVVHTDPCGTLPVVISMIPAPLSSVTSAQTSHKRAAPPPPAGSTDSRARIIANRSAGTSAADPNRARWCTVRSLLSIGDLHSTKGGAQRGPDPSVTRETPLSRNGDPDARTTRRQGAAGHRFDTVTVVDVRSMVARTHRAAAARRERGRLGAVAWRLVRGFDVAGAPGLVAPCLERSVQAQDREPAIAGDGSEPVDVGAVGSGRSEVDHGVAVRSVGTGPLVLLMLGHGLSVCSRARVWVS